MRFYRNPSDNPNTNFENTNVGDLDWYVMRTPPNREFDAEELLSRQGYTIMCPVRKKKIRSSRTKKAKNRTIELPLMPCYVLMGFKGVPNWQKLFSFSRPYQLVTSVCGFNRRAKFLPRTAHPWIEEMLATTSAEINDKGKHSKSVFSKGDNVEILDGPFEGFVVEVQKTNSKDAMCLFNLFGREQKVKVSVDNIQKAA
jgi:transcription antitermination factor NusG